MKLIRHFILVALILLTASAIVLTTSDSALSEDLPRTTLRIGVNPNTHFSTIAIIKGEGWDHEAGFELELKVATGPATQLQAFLSGSLDAMANNVGTILISADRLWNAGAEMPLIIAPLSTGGISLLAKNSPFAFPAESNKNLTVSLRSWSQSLKRPLTLVTNPKGSLPDLVPRYWAQQTKSQDFLKIINAVDQAQLQQLALAPTTDLIASFDPLTILLPHVDPQIRVIALPDILMKPQPSCAISVSRPFAKEHPEIVSALIRLNERAKLAIKERPERAVELTDALITRKLIPANILKQSLERLELLSTMQQLKDSTRVTHDVMVELRYLQRPLPLEDLYLPEVLQ